MRVSPVHPGHWGRGLGGQGKEGRALSREDRDGELRPHGQSGRSAGGAGKRSRVLVLRSGCLPRTLWSCPCPKSARKMQGPESRHTGREALRTPRSEEKPGGGGDRVTGSAHLKGSVLGKGGSPPTVAGTCRKSLPAIWWAHGSLSRGAVCCPLECWRTPVATKRCGDPCGRSE